MPTRVHAIVLASKLHKPTLRALAFARATRPNVLEAIYVSIDTKATNRLLEDWDERRLDIPLKVLHSPYREVVRPIVEYTQEIRRASPRGVVAVYIPEYVVGRWWEQLLHNQTALRLKGRLLFTPGVMVISVPYQLRSSQVAQEREKRDEERVHAGDLRRGRVASRPAHAGRSTTNEPVPARPRKARGRSRVGERFEAEVGPVAHGGHCVARLPSPRPGWCSYATRCRGSGWSSRSPRARTATGSGAVTPSRSLSASADRVDAPCPVRRPGAVRRLRLPARRRARPARPQGRRGARAARPPGSARRRLRPGRRAAGRGGPGGGPPRRRPALAHPAALRRAAGRPPGHAGAPLPPARRRRRLPDRCRGRATRRRPTQPRSRGRRSSTRSPRAGRPTASPSPPTGSGRCTPRRRACWSRRSWTCSLRRRGSGRSTSTPASASSRASSERPPVPAWSPSRPTAPPASTRAATWPR